MVREFSVWEIRVRRFGLRVCVCVCAFDVHRIPRGETYRKDKFGVEICLRHNMCVYKCIYIYMCT